ncbi:MAG: NAD(P)-dependent oxidoreductase [Sphingobacteriaceae bacterium]|jgi:dTDP-4-dehydrorhamnose reductase|nr:NAD(P)-dependent oxidoreductase [Sphingobacteriaceae bacterium]
MNKILVTGSNGLLGQKLTELMLKQKDITLIATSRDGNRYPEKEGYTYMELDITDEAETVQVISAVMPDVVINTAAVTQVDVCEKDKDACRDLNVEGVRNLIEICQTLNIHLIHLSTDFVFDGESGPYEEGAVPNPLSYYGTTKLQAEELVKQATCKWTIVRTVLVYGIVSDISRSNIVLWAKGALEKGQPIKVVSDHWRTPTLAEDLAEGCLLIARKGKTGIYHISGNEMMSILQLVYQVADFFNLDKSIITPIESSSLNEAPRPKKTGFIIDKAVKELGYKPHSFKEGVEILSRQLQQQG